MDPGDGVAAGQSISSGWRQRLRLVTCGAALLCLMPGQGSAQLMDGMYCGRENCYEVLGADAESTIPEIKKLYRGLARKYHPDRPGGSAEKFQRIATAYETLGDEEARKNYDYYLAHPEEAYYNQYRYYRHKATPKVDVMPIIIVVLTVTSVCQYLYWNGRYNSAISSAMRNPKIVQQAKALADEQGLLKNIPRDSHHDVLKKIVADKLDLRGSFAPASIWDVAWVQLIISPYTLSVYFYAKHIRWHYRYSVLKLDVADFEDDRIYLACRNLGISLTKFNCMQAEEQDEITEGELWITENAALFLKAKEDEARERYKNSTKYKWEKRWRKAQGR